jgi:hypothetical protein
MKKVLVVLAILLLGVPAVAKVTVTAEADASGYVTISYQMDAGDANLPRAFGIDVTVTGTKDPTITAIVDVNDSDYYVAPGTFEYDPCYPNDVNWGYAIVDLDSNSFTIEMGSLYDDDDPCHTTPPPPNGTLCKFVIDPCCEYYVDLEENSARGGVVMEDTEKAYDANYVVLVDANGMDITCPNEPIPDGNCFPTDGNYALQYADYITYRKTYLKDPNCWCESPVDQTHYQCDGDADGAKQGMAKYRVAGNDLDLVIANWKKKIDDPTINPCADIDHKKQGMAKYRVAGNDLDIVIANWKKKDGDLPNDCPRPD